MKYLLSLPMLFVYLVTVSQPARAAVPVKMGYINAIQIFDTTKIGKRSKVTLEDFVKVRQQIVNMDENEIKKLEEEISKQGLLLTEDSRKEKEIIFQRKVSQFQKRAADLNKEIQDKKTEVLREFNKILEAVVKTVAEKEGYEVVLDKNPDIGTVVYISSSMDISKEVIEQMDKQNP
jgi:outer membrane protein